MEMNCCFGRKFKMQEKITYYVVDSINSAIQPCAQQREFFCSGLTQFILLLPAAVPLRFLSAIAVAPEKTEKQTDLFLQILLLRDIGCNEPCRKTAISLRHIWEKNTVTCLQRVKYQTPNPADPPS